MKRENNLWNQDKMKKGLRELKRKKKSNGAKDYKRQRRTPGNQC